MDIGKKLKDLRESKGYSVREFAKRCDLSPSLVSQVERSVSSPSISSLVKMAEVLQIPVGHFFEEHDNGNHIIRKAERRKLVYPNHTTTYEFATPPEMDGEFRVLLVTLQAKEYSSEHKVSHQDKEFCFVIEGTVEIEIENSHITLEEGDAMTFNSQAPHRFYNPLEKEVRFLLAINKN
jgi:transcriptional regulator with XRE-family HTH domain